MCCAPFILFLFSTQWLFTVYEQYVYRFSNNLLRKTNETNEMSERTWIKKEHSNNNSEQKIHFILNRCEELLLLLLVVDIVYNSEVCICDFTFVYSPRDRIKVKIVYMHSHIHFFSFFFFSPIRKNIYVKNRENQS